MSIIDELLPLVGVVVGAATSYLVTARSERLRYERERRDRWDRDELGAYADYLGAVATMARAAGRVAAARGLDPVGSASPIDDGLTALDDAESRRTELFERVVLMGDDQVLAKGRDLNESIWKLEWIARGLVPASSHDWTDRRNAYVSNVQAFHSAARNALDVPGSADAARAIESSWVS